MTAISSAYWLREIARSAVWSSVRRVIYHLPFSWVVWGLGLFVGYLVVSACLRLGRWSVRRHLRRGVNAAARTTARGVARAHGFDRYDQDRWL